MLNEYNWKEAIQSMAAMELLGGRKTFRLPLWRRGDVVSHWIIGRKGAIETAQRASTGSHDEILPGWKLSVDWIRPLHMHSPPVTREMKLNTSSVLLLKKRWVVELKIDPGCWLWHFWWFLRLGKKVKVALWNDVRRRIIKFKASLKIIRNAILDMQEKINSYFITLNLN